MWWSETQLVREEKSVGVSVKVRGKKRNAGCVYMCCNGHTAHFETSPSNQHFSSLSVCIQQKRTEFYHIYVYIVQSICTDTKEMCKLEWIFKALTSLKRHFKTLSIGFFSIIHRNTFIVINRKKGFFFAPPQHKIVIIFYLVFMNTTTSENFNDSHKYDFVASEPHRSHFIQLNNIDNTFWYWFCWIIWNIG